MLKKPKNYEEARKILEDSVDDKFTKSVVKVSKLKLLFTSIIGAALLSAVQIFAHDPTITALSIPAVAALCAPGLAPYFVNKSTINQIKNGKYFEKKSPENIMGIADTYVDDYNEYEEKHPAKKGK